MEKTNYPRASYIGCPWVPSVKSIDVLNSIYGESSQSLELYKSGLRSHKSKFRAKRAIELTKRGCF